MTITNDERIEGSHLIAKFIGGKEYWLSKNVITFPLFDNPELSINGTTTYSIDDLKFDSSWEWLFIVIDKVNGLGKEYNLTIFKTYIALTVEKGGKVYKDFSFAHSEYITKDQTGKEAAFKLLVKFIKWYNEHILNTNLKSII